jgi:pimeloyl-ACP methyl ester carboxylesterase
VLEFARRGRAGAVVALDPGGFWEGWERSYVHTTLGASVAALRLMAPALPMLAHNAAARTLLLPQLSARPWALNGDHVEQELASFAKTSVFPVLLTDLAYGPLQEGPAAPGSGPVTIGWGRHDRVCLPVQAARAQAAFPEARLHWFDHSGHFPMWDEPDAAISLIREGTGG